jgi:hypothetical protein
MQRSKTKILKTKPKLSDREILRQLGEMFGAHPEDVVRSLERFKKELDEAKAKLGELK